MFDFRNGAEDQEATVAIDVLDEKDILRQENQIEAQRLKELLSDSDKAEERYLGLMEEEVRSILNNNKRKHKYHKQVRQHQIDSTYR